MTTTDLDTLPDTGAQFATPATLVGDPYGIEWRGPWEKGADSFGQVTRRMIRAIERARMPVAVPMSTGRSSILAIDVDPDAMRDLGAAEDVDATRLRRERFGEAEPPVFSLPGCLTRHLDRKLVTVWHALPRPDMLHHYLYPTGSARYDSAEVAKLHRYQFLMTALERDRVDADTAALLRQFGQVWVPCERNKRALLDSGVERVHVVPHPADLARGQAVYLRKVQLQQQGPAQGPFVFYHIGKWEARKNQFAMLRAFLRAFTPQDNVAFLLKTSRFGHYKDYPDGPTQALAALTAEACVRAQGWTAESIQRAIRLNTDTLPEERILDLHAVGACYVNVGHGEAFDLPAADALAAGNQILHTGFGGTEDYVERNHPRARVWSDADGTVPCHGGYRWGTARWARVDEDRVVSAYRAVFTDRGLVPPSRGRFHTPEEVGAQCRALILAACDLTEEKLHAFR